MERNTELQLIEEGLSLFPQITVIKMNISQNATATNTFPTTL